MPDQWFAFRFFLMGTCVSFECLSILPKLSLYFLNRVVQICCIRYLNKCPFFSANMSWMPINVYCLSFCILLGASKTIGLQHLFIVSYCIWKRSICILYHLGMSFILNMFYLYLFKFVSFLYFCFDINLCKLQ